MKIQRVVVGNREYEFIIEAESLVDAAFLAEIMSLLEQSHGTERRIDITSVEHIQKTWAGYSVKRAKFAFRC